MVQNQTARLYEVVASVSVVGVSGFTTWPDLMNFLIVLFLFFFGRPTQHSGS